MRGSYSQEAMRLARDVLKDAVKSTHFVDPPQPVFVGVPAPEYRNTFVYEPGVRCAWCNAPPEAMHQHWKMRNHVRVCLSCKGSYRVTRGTPQYSAEECARIVEERVAGLDQETLAAMKDTADMLTVRTWEDPTRLSHAVSKLIRTRLADEARAAIARRALQRRRRSRASGSSGGPAEYYIGDSDDEPWVEAAKRQRV